MKQIVFTNIGTAKPATPNQIKIAKLESLVLKQSRDLIRLQNRLNDLLFFDTVIKDANTALNQFLEDINGN